MAAILAAFRVLAITVCCYVGPIFGLRGAEEASDSLVLENASMQGIANRSFRVKLHRASRKAAPAQLRGADVNRHATLLQMHHTSRMETRRPQPVQVFGVIQLGSPPQQFTMAFDTGSGNMVVPSSLCQSISCLSHRPYDESTSLTVKPIPRLDMEAGPTPDDGMGRETIKISIGTGYAKGNIAMERVCLDEKESVCTMTGMVEALEMSDEPFNMLPYDGILGLGMPGASIDKRFNIMGNLAEEGLLQRNMFAVWLAHDECGLESDCKNDGEDSEITFGEIDSKRLGSEIMWFPVSSTDTGMWQATLKDFYVKDTKLGLCSSNGCQVAFDTGTDAIAGPARIVTPLLEQLNIDKDCSNYEDLPTIGFQLGEYVLSLEPPDYVQKQAANCWPKIKKLDLPPPVGPITLLGDPFLKKYYTVYDRMALRIGVGLAKHKMPSAKKGETLEDAAKRLIKQHNPS